MKKFIAIISILAFLIISIPMYSVTVLGSSDLVSSEDGVLFTEALEFNVGAGTAPSLPEKVKVLLANGELVEKDVVWDEIPTENLNKAGEFQITGKVDGTDIPSYCKINVIESENDNPTDEKPNVSVSGNISGLKKPIIKQLAVTDSDLADYRAYVSNPDLLRGYSICNSDGTALEAKGDDTKIVIEIGSEHNGEVWTLLKIVDEMLQETPCTVEKGKLNVTANGASMKVIFLMPAPVVENNTGNDINKADIEDKEGKPSQFNIENEEAEDTIGNGKYIFAGIGLLIILLILYITGKNSAKNEATTGVLEKNPFVNICKKAYLALNSIFKMKDGKKPDIYTEIESESKVQTSEEADFEEAELKTEEAENVLKNEQYNEENTDDEVSEEENQE